MPEERRQKVVAIGSGRFRVVTIITKTEEMDEGQLLELGLQPPASDLPWAQPVPVHGADRVAALQYWTEHLGGYDPRLSGRVNGFIQELGLKSIFEAIDQVAAMNLKDGAGVKYAEFIRRLGQIRDRRGDR